MVASRNLKVPPRVWKYTGLHIFYPGSIHSQWHFILRFTRRRTSMTSDAFTVVDEKSVVHDLPVYLAGPQRQDRRLLQGYSDESLALKRASDNGILTPDLDIAVTEAKECDCHSLMRIPNSFLCPCSP